MEITLEKIELVKDRTGATYTEAKEALEATNGSVVDAILAIEEKTGKVEDTPHIADNPIFKKIKAIVDKGNMSKIIINSNGREVINFPITVGVMGVVLAPWAVIFGVIATLGLDCEVLFANEKGELYDINGRLLGTYGKVKSKTSKYTEKGADLIKKVKKQVKDTADEIKTRTEAIADIPLKENDFEVDFEIIEEEKQQ